MRREQAKEGISKTMLWQIVCFRERFAGPDFQQSVGCEDRGPKPA
jgi:hypothetical protein